MDLWHSIKRIRITLDAMDRSDDLEVKNYANRIRRYLDDIAQQVYVADDDEGDDADE